MRTRFEDVEVAYDVGDDQLTVIVTVGYEPPDDVWIERIGAPVPLEALDTIEKAAYAAFEDTRERARDEDYERAAHRSQMCDFSDSNGRDWT
jgi:hypothetical protein